MEHGFNLKLMSGRILGTGTERDGLYYLDNAPAPLALSTRCSPAKDELTLLHYRLGHVSFQSLSRLFPSKFNISCKEGLVCDVCELAKHTRTSYPSTSEKTNIPFEVVHPDVWGPSVVTDRKSVV